MGKNYVVAFSDPLIKCFSSESALNQEEISIVVSVRSWSESFCGASVQVPVGTGRSQGQVAEWSALGSEAQKHHCHVNYCLPCLLWGAVCPPCWRMHFYQLRKVAPQNVVMFGAFYPPGTSRIQQASGWHGTNLPRVSLWLRRSVMPVCCSPSKSSVCTWLRWENTNYTSALSSCWFCAELCCANKSLHPLPLHALKFVAGLKISMKLKTTTI